VVIPITAAITAPQAAAEPRKRSQAETAALARGMLAQLKVARPLSIRGYNRKRFQPRWAPHKGRCNTRETVLARDGRRVRRDAACHPVKGLWYSPYDGKRLKSDKRWSQAKRRAFANDLTRPELLTVSHSANIAKGGQGPQSWRPQRRAHWCRYASSWITVKRHYRLFVTRREKVALLNMLRTC
jgi:hypothetical protein